MSNFAELLSAPDRMPGFWSGILGTLYRYAHGGTLDQFFQIHWARLRASWPSYATDASIGEIARDRGIPLFDGETRLSKEARLRGWRTAHREAGLPLGEIHQGLPLWLPERPTIRVVAGNSALATWCTLYGDDETAALDGATDDELNDERTVILTDPLTDKEYEIPVGRKPRFHHATTSNWDWDSGYFSDPLVSAVEPQRIDRFFYIVYKPDSIDFYGPDLPEDATISINSTMPVQDVKNVGSCLSAWKREGSTPWGWILAGDPASFEPTGSGAGYPDGSWWQAINRLDTARYELLHDPTEI